MQMKTIGIIAEFNPFHKGHLHLINECKKELCADRCVVIMSGDFVQRGAPAIMDKLSRAQMALMGGADVVLELPIYYSLGSAEYFAGGAVSILDSIGCAYHLCFGSESGDISVLTKIASLLNDEPDEFKTALSANLKSGLSFAKARENAVLSVLGDDDSSKEISLALSSPNNILAIEYIKALLKRNSKISPYTISRIGSDYNSADISEVSSATAIRKLILENEKNHETLSEKFSEPANSEDIEHRAFLNDLLSDIVPSFAKEIIADYHYSFAETNALSDLLWFKLTIEKNRGFDEYLDVNTDLSNKITARLNDFTSFDNLCESLKSKELTYSRISRALMHILLDIKADKMASFKEDNFTGYARILGAKKESSDLIKKMRESSCIPVIGNLKEANSSLSPLQRELFDATILSSQVYSKLFFGSSINEFQKPLLLM